MPGSLVGPAEAQLRVQEEEHRLGHKPSLGHDGAQNRGSSVPCAHEGSHGPISSIQSDSGNKFLQLVWQGRKSRLKLCVSDSKIIIKKIPLTFNFKGIQNMKIHHYIVW